MYTDADRAKTIHVESKQLEQFLSALSLEDWQCPSRCESWQVADVVAHLIEDQHAERFGPDANRTRAVRYRLAMTAPVRAIIDILLNADGASVESVSPVEADVIFHCETAIAILVIFGRLPLRDVIADGRVHVEGEQQLATAFEQCFQGG